MSSPEDKQYFTPSLHNVWAILSIAFVIVCVTGVGFYAIYTCYRSAAYQQQQLELTRTARKQEESKVYEASGLEENTSDGRKALDGCFDTENLKLETRYRFILRPGYNQSVTSFATSTRSSPSTPDLTSLPLAVTYPTHTPHFHHVSPILGFQDKYNSSPCSPPLTFDRNNIPFFAPEQAVAPINPKLGPIGGSFSFMNSKGNGLSSPTTTMNSPKSSQVSPKFNPGSSCKTEHRVVDSLDSSQAPFEDIPLGPYINVNPTSFSNSLPPPPPLPPALQVMKDVKNTRDLGPGREFDDGKKTHVRRRSGHRPRSENMPFSSNGSFDRSEVVGKHLARPASTKPRVPAPKQKTSMKPKVPRKPLQPVQEQTPAQKYACAIRFSCNQPDPFNVGV